MPSPFKKEASPPETEPTGESRSAIQKAVEIQKATQEALQKKQIEQLNEISSFDWKAVPPPMLAQMLVQMPFKGGAGEPDYFLAPWQAMVFAMRCFELGLSPFSNEVWFNPKNNKVNVTFEGKLKLARKQGLDLGPPTFERIPKDPDKPLVAYRCTISSPNGNCQYTATLKEWQVLTSPVWKAKPDHMLQLRAAEKCLSFASGIGTSELPGEADLGTEPEKRELPTIDATKFEYKEMSDANASQQEKAQ
ncbi:hypothetical protein J2P12_00120 [Candidatus Bathyarchaeota archaeon]|nr:hypothetical protein [Candidatus Bathyarchaeota archaeon]